MLRNGPLFLLSILLVSCFEVIQPEVPTFENDYKLQVIYVAPITSTPYTRTSPDKAVAATLEMQRYLQAATGGKTFEILNEEYVVDVIYPLTYLDEYEEDWEGTIIRDLEDEGIPVEAKGTLTIVWVDGIDRFDEDNYILTKSMCEGECGISIMPIRSVLAGDWIPIDLSVPIHELGHLMGLQHPIEADDLPLSEDDEVMRSSFMCPSDLREGITTNDFGFLTNEKEILKNSPFLKENVPLYQRYWAPKILNYPVMGAPPDASFAFQVPQFAAIEFSVVAPEDHQFYWYFGDGSTSSEREPAHNYRSGIYSVTLIVTAPNNMTSTFSQYIEVP